MNIWVFVIAVPVVLISYWVKKNPDRLKFKFGLPKKKPRQSANDNAVVDESMLGSGHVRMPPARTMVLVSIAGYYQPLLELEYGLSSGYSFDDLKAVAKTEGDLLNLCLCHLSKEELVRVIDQQQWPITQSDLAELPMDLLQAKKWLDARRLNIEMLTGDFIAFPKEPLFRN